MKPEVSLLASTTLSLEQENNPWLAAEARFDEAATRLNLDDGLQKVLRTSAKEITVHIPVQLGDGRLEVFTGYRVQHSIARGPGKGGIRFAPDVTPRRRARAGLLDDDGTGLAIREITRAVYLKRWQPSPKSAA